MRCEGHSDAHGRDCLLAVQEERLLKGFGDPRRQLACKEARRPRSQYGELVAAEPSDQIARAGTSAEARGRFLEKLITCLMAKRVVYGLEAVEVEAEYGERSAVVRSRRA